MAAQPTGHFAKNSHFDCNYSFLSKLMEVVIFLCSHTQILLALSIHVSGFSNETLFAFEFQAVLGIYKNKLKVEGPDPYVKCTLQDLIIRSGVCFSILFVLVDTILLSLDPQKRPCIVQIFFLFLNTYV